MLSFTSLSISGYRNEPVPNTFIRQDHTAQHLAILLPGYAYRATMPLLFNHARLWSVCWRPRPSTPLRPNALPGTRRARPRPPRLSQQHLRRTDNLIVAANSGIINIVPSVSFCDT